MSKEKMILILKLLLILYFVINVIWGILVTIFHYNLKGQLNSPSNTIETSKKKGVFVKELSAIPSRLSVENRTIEIKEVWIENVNVVSFVVSIIPGLYQFPVYTKENSYNVCITFFDDTFFISKEWLHYFISFENSKKGFTEQSNTLCYDTVRDLYWTNKTIFFRKSWGDKGNFKVILKK